MLYVELGKQPVGQCQNAPASHSRTHTKTGKAITDTADISTCSLSSLIISFIALSSHLLSHIPQIFAAHELVWPGGQEQFEGETKFNVNKLQEVQAVVHLLTNLQYKPNKTVMVWCGVERVWNAVWHGVMSCGGVWYGVECCGMVWCGVMWCGVGVTWCGAVWCGIVQCGGVYSVVK